jgi:CDP-diacylglycerol--serine O-phosphatidyltransferase
LTIKKYIPNTITSLNLFSGCLAIIMVFQGQLHLASIFIGIAAILDFFDGFAARLLNAYSEIGKQLDSLADVISFGVAPSFILYRFMNDAVQVDGFYSGMSILNMLLMSLPFLVAIFSAIRLAIFNIDTKQTNSFIGLPTPANAILIASLPILLWMHNYSFLNNILSNVYFLVGFIVLQAYLLVSPIPMFSLKFKNFSWGDNKLRFIFLGVSIILLVFFQALAIPVIILLYVLISVLSNWIIRIFEARHN